MHQKQQEKQNEAQAGAITIKCMICNKEIRNIDSS